MKFFYRLSASARALAYVLGDDIARDIIMRAIEMARIKRSAVYYTASTGEVRVRVFRLKGREHLFAEVTYDRAKRAVRDFDIFTEGRGRPLIHLTADPAPILTEGPDDPVVFDDRRFTLCTLYPRRI
jgi:hypothetical protein